MGDPVGLGEYLVGCALLAAVLGAAAWVASVVDRRRLAGLTGAPRALAFALVMTLTVMAIHLVPAMLTVLSKGTVLAAAVVVALAATRVPRARTRMAPSPPPPAAGEGLVSWGLVAVAGAVLAGWLLVAMKIHATQAIRHVDMLTVYLPDSARLIQSGSIWHNEQFVPLLANGNYPQNGLLLQLSSILPFRQDAFAREALLPFAALTVVALYALAREIGAPRPAAWLGGIAFVAIPHVAFLSTQGLSDDVLFFGFATGVLFLVRHMRTGATADLVLAGAALGLGFGTKWYGVPAAAAVLGLWLVFRLGRERAWRPVADAALATVAVLAAGGIWLVRNLVVTSSPTFPSPVEPLGITLFDAPFNPLTERFGHTISEYLLERHMWADYLVPAWWDAWGPVVPLALLGAAGAVILTQIRGRTPFLHAQERGPSPVLLLAACSAVLLVAYTVTPNSAWGPEGAPLLVGANARYALPAVIIAVALTAWFAGQGRWRIVVEAAFAVSVLVGVLKAPLDLPDGQVVVAIVLLLAVAAVAVASPVRPWARRAWPALAAVALLAVMLGGRTVQVRHEEQRYVRHDAAAAFVTTYARGGYSVGIAGREAKTDTSPVYPAFGSRLDNRVEYVGPFVDDLLRTYDDQRSFTAALRRGGYDLLVVYRPLDPAEVAREQTWAERAGYSELAEDDRVTLLGRR